MAIEEAFRLYSVHNGEEVSCTLDKVDYNHFIRWRWKVKLSRRSQKLYFMRTPHVAGDKNKTIYLHIEIMRRKGDKPPTEEHTIVHHINDDSLKNERVNLEWQTPKGNTPRGEKNGMHASRRKHFIKSASHGKNSQEDSNAHS